MIPRGKLACLLCIAVLCSAMAAAQDEMAAVPVEILESSAPPAPQLEVGAPFDVTVVHTDIAGDPTAAVPGIAGAQFSSFDRPYGSPNGNWILTADTDLPSGADEVLLVNDVVEVVEGGPATWTATELVGFLDTRASINDAGDWVFATNTDGDTGADEYIVQSVSGVLSAAAQEGATIPALTPPLSVTPATWGSTLDSPVIAADGTVGFASDNVGGPPTTENDILVLGTALLAQEGITQPADQLGTEFWENFDISDFWISADGSHWLAQGDLTGDSSTDDVVVVDGAVVIQEGVVIPGSGFPNPVDSFGIVGVHMDAGGNWYARGNNDVSELDWVVRNGTVVAAVGDPIFAGATEVWDDTDYSPGHFLHVGNSVGDYVIGGVTDAPVDSDSVLVANGTVVVAREGEPIDLDGNGTFDDNAFFNTFGNDDAFLSDDRILYIVGTMRDDTGTSIGDGFFAIDLTSLGAVPNDDCSSAITVTDGSPAATFDTTDATFDGTGTCMTSPNIWYQYTATCTGTATIDLCGSSYDTKLAVYDGFICDPLGPELGCNDDSCGLQSLLEIPVTAGDELLIEVGGYASNVGAGVLNISCSGAPAIGLEKTVGTSDTECATTNAIEVAPGTTVYYCYEVTNSGTVTFTLHDLVDDQLGTILSGFAYTLEPGTSVNTFDAGLTIPAVITDTTVNTGTWTAFDDLGASAVATATATVTVVVPPDAGVSPTSLASSLLVGTTAVEQLTINNTGGSDLTWDLFEEPLENLPGPPGGQPPVTRIDSQAAMDAEVSGLEPEGQVTAGERDPEMAALAQRLLLGAGLLLIPESSNDRVMAFDATTGNLVDADFIPADTVNLSTPIHAILSSSGDSILVSDQIEDVVQEYALDGTYIGVFAPAGGANTAILDNIRGISLRSNGNLLVTVGGGTNADSVAEFDTSGNYLGNFVANGSGGLDSPFDVTSIVNWMVGGITSDAIHMYDDTGAYLSDLAPIDSFPEQVAAAGNGNILVANFSGAQEGIVEFTPAGGVVGVYDPPSLGGYRGVYELPNGNLLVTNGGGVHEIDRSGNLVETKIADVSARFIEEIAPQAGCTNLADVTWLSADPITGTTPPASSTPVDVTFDATVVPVGIYDANLCLFSNDPDEPVIPVPVEMEVVIPVELMGFSVE